MKYPSRTQLSDVRWCDLIQTAEPTTRIIAVVGHPVGTHRLRYQIFGLYIDGSRDRRGGIDLCQCRARTQESHADQRLPPAHLPSPPDQSRPNFLMASPRDFNLSM